MRRNRGEGRGVESNRVERREGEWRCKCAYKVFGTDYRWNVLSSSRGERKSVRSRNETCSIRKFKTIDRTVQDNQ